MQINIHLITNLLKKNPTIAQSIAQWKKRLAY